MQVMQDTRSQGSVWSRLLGEPLLHFAVLGLLLFLAYGWLQGTGREDSSAIRVDAQRIELLRWSFQRAWRRDPTAGELQGLVDDYVREELAVREARALGLDTQDAVIRRLLRQKLEFIASDIALQADPDDAELRTFMAQHPQRFQRPARYSLAQLYLDPQRRGADLPVQAQQLLQQLNAPSSAAIEWRSLGDPSQLESELRALTADELARQFGPDFAASLANLPLGSWSGPVASAYGEHLLRIDAVEPAGMPELAEIREQVRRDWESASKETALDAFYVELRKRYPLEIDPSGGEPLGGIPLGGDRPDAESLK
jgi:hypothetical protein